MMKNYLSQRNQRTKVNKYYSSWEETFFGVSQNSVLGPILFNIFVQLLQKDGSASTQHKNIQTLASEMIKIKNGMSPEIVSDVFVSRTGNYYNLRPSTV